MADAQESGDLLHHEDGKPIEFESIAMENAVVEKVVNGGGGKQAVDRWVEEVNMAHRVTKAGESTPPVAIDTNWDQGKVASGDIAKTLKAAAGTIALNDLKFAKK